MTVRKSRSRMEKRNMGLVRSCSPFFAKPLHVSRPGQQSLRRIFLRFVEYRHLFLIIGVHGLQIMALFLNTRDRFFDSLVISPPPYRQSRDDRDEKQLAD